MLIDLSYLRYPLPPDVQRLFEAGDFSRMERVIAARLADSRTPETLKKRLTFQLAIAREIPASYPLTRSALLAQPQGAIRDFMPEELETLRAFRANGGKLVVFHSASPALAALMDVKPLGYSSAPYPGAWSRMNFNSPVPAGLPRSVLQTSGVLLRAQPLPGKGRVIATWADRMGRSTGEPAWIATSGGFWMTHVLLADTWNQTKDCRYIVNPPWLNSRGRADYTIHQHTAMGEGEVDFDGIFETLREMDFANKQLKPDAPKVGGDNIACVSMFGFPEKMDKQAPEARERIERELLGK